MSERINTPYTSEHFVAFCLSMLGQPYWYGTVVYKCSESLRSRKAKQYPSHYKDSRTARYKQDIANKKVCADCVGLIKGYNWTSGGVGVKVFFCQFSHIGVGLGVEHFACLLDVAQHLFVFRSDLGQLLKVFIFFGKLDKALHVADNRWVGNQ